MVILSFYCSNFNTRNEFIYRLKYEGMILLFFLPKIIFSDLVKIKRKFLLLSKNKK